MSHASFPQCRQDEVANIRCLWLLDILPLSVIPLQTVLPQRFSIKTLLFLVTWTLLHLPLSAGLGFFMLSVKDNVMFHSIPEGSFGFLKHRITACTGYWNRDMFVMISNVFHNPELRALAHILETTVCLLIIYYTWHKPWHWLRSFKLNNWVTMQMMMVWRPLRWTYWINSSCNL